MPMRTLALTLFAGVVTAGCAVSSPDAAAMRAAANAADSGYFAAVNRGDFGGAMANYWTNPDVLSISVTDGVAQATRGPAAIRQGLEALAKAMPGARIELLEQTNEPRGDFVIGWGKWRVVFPAADSAAPPPPLIGCYFDVKAVRDGKMVALVDYTVMACGSSVPAATP